MEMSIRLGDHMMVVAPVRMTDEDDRHEITAWITADQGLASGPAKSVLVDTEQQAITVVRDFLANEPDENGPFAEFFPHLMP